MVSYEEITVKTDLGVELVDKADSGKVRPWSVKKRMSLRVAELYGKAMQKEKILTDNRYKSLLECGDSLLFGEEETASAGKKRLIQANFCRLRLCPVCNWRKSLKMFAQVSRISEELLKQKPTTRFLFLTLTIRNVTGDEFTNAIDALNKAFRYIFSPEQTFAPAALLKKNLLGYLRAMEVTYNGQENTYHPHLHILVALKPAYFSRGYLAHKDWQELWGKALKLDYKPMVNVKAVKAVSANAIAEIAKYPTKIAKLTELEDEERAVDALLVLHKGLKGRRLITFGGVFRQIQRQLKLDDVESGDLVHVESDIAKTVNFVGYALYRYKAELGVYVC